tara:strand:- start:8 stop:346 length:339 start_codon:yes stop_codon:yes gene_type:complete
MRGYVNIGDMVRFKNHTFGSWLDEYDSVADDWREEPVEIFPGTMGMILDIKKHCDAHPLESCDCEFDESCCLVLDVLVNGILSCGWQLSAFRGVKGVANEEKYILKAAKIEN